jgi:hypothetical protein
MSSGSSRQRHLPTIQVTYRRWGRTYTADIADAPPPTAKERSRARRSDRYWAAVAAKTGTPIPPGPPRAAGEPEAVAMQKHLGRTVTQVPPKRMKAYGIIMRGSKRATAAAKSAPG